MFTKGWFQRLIEQSILGIWRGITTVCVSSARFIRRNWREALAFIALVLLATSAAYGVYVFSLLFVPNIFALITASAFEATYIGLGVARLKGDQRVHAQYISGAAVSVSVLYNTIGAITHLFPNAISNLLLALTTATGGALFGLWIIVILFALLHGAPLAVTAYFLSNLILHKNDEGSYVNEREYKQHIIRKMIDNEYSDNAIFAIIGGNSAATRAMIREMRETV